MNNIGYSIFKKSSTLTIESNGMFEDVQLLDSFNALFPLVPSGKQLLCFKRIAGNNTKPSLKDAYLIVLLESVNQNDILGSAICFKSFKVNEDKIINGVQYLLSQLKQNLSANLNDGDQNLGVLLPSTNKDFKIFKSEKLVAFAHNPSLVGYDTISFVNNEAQQFLHYFQSIKDLGDIESLLLSDQNIRGYLEGSKINPLSVKNLLKPKKSSHITVSKPNNFVEESNNVNVVITNLKEEKEKIIKSRNIFITLSAVFFLLFTFFAIQTLINSSNTSDISNDDDIYEVGDDLFISFSSYNVNIRSTPNADNGDSNLKTTLADGDKVHLLGFDKETLWAKIRYDDDQIGYVSNRLISKQVATNRVRPVYKIAIISSGFISAPLYTSPGEIKEEYPAIKLYLKEGDKVLVKNQDLKLDSYSVSVEKDNKVYHGFMQKKYFYYQQY
jgi:hypothetical protein